MPEFSFFSQLLPVHWHARGRSLHSANPSFRQPSSTESSPVLGAGAVFTTQLLPVHSHTPGRSLHAANLKVGQNTAGSLGSVFFLHLLPVQTHARGRSLQADWVSFKQPSSKESSPVLGAFLVHDLVF